MRVAASGSVGRASGHLDLIDFRDNASHPQPASYSLGDWQRKLGLLVEQGDLIPLAAR